VTYRIKLDTKEIIFWLSKKISVHECQPSNFIFKLNFLLIFYVCVSVHHRCNNINSQLDATIIILLIISISSTCFGRYFRPSSGVLDCVYNSVPRHPGHQQAASSVFYTENCKHSLVLLRMGEIIARNMLSWLKLLIKLLLLHVVGCLYHYVLITVMRSLKKQ